jgi:hypothetical protein
VEVKPDDWIVHDPEPELIEPDDVGGDPFDHSNRWKAWKRERTLSQLWPKIIIDTIGWSPAIEHTPRKGELCQVCEDRDLEFSACCLGCLRCGNRWITPGERLPDRRLYQPDGVLKGGR